jgi:hypothetical protein
VIGHWLESGLFLVRNGVHTQNKWCTPEIVRTPEKRWCAPEVISLCNLDEILPEENYFGKSFLIDAHLISQNRSFSLRPLIDSGSAAYTIIHTNLVDRVTTICLSLICFATGMLIFFKTISESCGK